MADYPRINYSIHCAWPKANQATISSLQSVIGPFVKSGLSDKHYLIELGNNTNGKHVSRLWEAMLYGRLKDAGYCISSAAAGPDFILCKKGSKIHVEAVAPQRYKTGGGTSNGCGGRSAANVSGHDVNYDQIVLQITSVLKTKIEKHSLWAKQSVIKDNIPFVIAVHDGMLRSGNGHSPVSGLPLILHAVFPIGGRAAIEYAKPGVPTWEGNEWRLNIPKKNGSVVLTDAFLSAAYANVSALIYCWDYQRLLLPIVLGPSFRHPPYVVVHNPNAKQPLERGWLPGAIEYTATIGNSLQGSELVITRH